MVVAGLTIFNGCQKDEFGVSQMANDEQPRVAVKPDVYVENGYLVFKGIEAVDSVINMLASMTEEKKEDWEAGIGFKSARAEFSKLYGEYEKLESKEEYLSFRSKFESKLKFEGENPEEWSVDYPFATRYFIPVLNEEGVLKIGKSIIKYTKQNHIIVLDGDLEKLNNLDKYANNDEVIIKPILKSSGDASISMDNFADDNPDPYQNPDEWYTVDKRRLRNELIWDTYYYDDGFNVYSGWKLLFYQKGETKGIFGWRRYKTVYGTQDIYVKVGNYPSYWINRYVAKLTPEVYDSTIECGADHQTGTTQLFYYRPTVDFSAITYSRGVGLWYPVTH